MRTCQISIIYTRANGEKEKKRQALVEFPVELSHCWNNYPCWGDKTETEKKKQLEASCWEHC